MNPKTPTAEIVGRLVAARPLKELARSLAAVRAATASGLWGSSVAAVVAAIEKELHRPIVLVCGHLDEADDLADDLELFTGRRPDVMRTRQLAFGGFLDRLAKKQVADRLQLISRYAGGIGKSDMLVASIENALMQSRSRPASSWICSFAPSSRARNWSRRN